MFFIVLIVLIFALPHQTEAVDIWMHFKPLEEARVDLGISVNGPSKEEFIASYKNWYAGAWLYQNQLDWRKAILYFGRKEGNFEFKFQNYPFENKYDFSIKYVLLGLPILTKGTWSRTEDIAVGLTLPYSSGKLSLLPEITFFPDRKMPLGRIDLKLEYKF